jgi:hypothetical protein
MQMMPQMSWPQRVAGVAVALDSTIVLVVDMSFHPLLQVLLGKLITTSSGD